MDEANERGMIKGIIAGLVAGLIISCGWEPVKHCAFEMHDMLIEWCAYGHH